MSWTDRIPFCSADVVTILYLSNMKIETLEIAGLRGVLEALRLPFNKGARSRTEFKWSQGMRGDGLTDVAPLRVMYLTSLDIDPRDISLMETLVKRGDEHAKAIRGIVVYAKITAPIFFFIEEETYRVGHERLSSESTMHGVARGLVGDDLQRVKSNLPMGTELTKVDYFSYQTLRRIVIQRNGHRLAEWRQFIDWVRTLPLSRELIFCGTDVPF